MAEWTRRQLLAGAGALALCSSAPRAARTMPALEREGLVEELKRASSEGQAAVEEVLARAVADPGAVMRGLGEPRKATIEAIHREARLSVYNIVWPPHTVLVPHDHRMWASIGVYTGREDNIMWRRAGSSIEATSAASVAARQIFSLPEDAIHSVTNPVEAYTAAIHVYGGDLSGIERSQWDARTLREEPFDVEDGQRILEEADRRFAAPRS